MIPKILNQHLEPSKKNKLKEDGEISLTEILFSRESSKDFQTKEQIFEILNDFDDIDKQSMWDSIIFELEDYKENNDETIDPTKEKLLQSCLNFFKDFSLSKWQTEYFIKFIYRTINWYITNHKVSIHETKGFISKKILKVEEVKKLKLSINTLNYNEIYVNEIIPSRDFMNHKINESFSEQLYQDFVYDLNIDIDKLNQNSDLVNLINIFLLFNLYTNKITPFEKFKKNHKYLKFENIYSNTYMKSIDKSLHSLFIIELIDSTNHICWLRDIFDDKKLYPVYDLSMSKNQTCLNSIFYTALVPFIISDKAPKVYTHNGGGGTFVFYSKNNISTLLTNNITASKKLTRNILKEVIKEYNNIKSEVEYNMHAKLKKINFKGDVKKYETIYVLIYNRVNQGLKFNNKIIKPKK